ncbi:uncharacterized protein BDZ99DRAFT_564685 [Mytilinidion resinicola]|uniref:BRCT domain-containing protein n=1 Tax=Mytilinidion resinicola TaxID=574789 RepID=A0A6A6Z991_9PEZI|nr:uncharacterized protein BDZ99DRAFT_564685 [Mytilinidion resinicola]KAF2816854.1 hypothetical protein BDZ99DRAFT_564685 [Mytilinidion resinicola]
MEHSVTVTLWQLSETSFTWNLLEGQSRDIVESGDGSYILSIISSEKAVGSITVEPCGVKLQAKAEPICVIPKEASPHAEYTLNASSSSSTEIIFLRDGDTFFVKSPARKFHVEVRKDQVDVGNDQVDDVSGEVNVENDLLGAGNDCIEKVQVRSSASTANVVDLQNGDADSDQTEDEEIDIPNSLLDEATPNPTLERADLVEETPTSRRLQQAQSGKASSATLTGEYVSPQELDLRGTNPAGMETGITQEPYCTAPGNTGDAKDVSRHNEKDLEPTSEPPPRQKGVSVVIERAHSKRSSPVDLDGDNLDARGPPSKKRRTSNDDSQDSRIEEIVVDTNTRQSRQANFPRKTSKSRKRSSSPIANHLRSSQNTVTESQLYELSAPRVAFSYSTIPDQKKFMAFLEMHSGKKVEAVKDANILCVGRSEVKKTGKLLRAIVLGVAIVTDDWFISSHAMGRLLNPDRFAPRDHKNEKAWGFSLYDVLGKEQRTIFSGMTICFTPAMKEHHNSFITEMRDIVLEAGAEKVITRAATGVKDDGNTIVIAVSDEKDTNAAILQDRGMTCYTRDLLSTSILRGSLDLESDEFIIKPDSSHGAGAPKKFKRGRPRKS